MAGEQQVTGPEVIASMLALPQVAPTPPLENEIVATAAYETLERNNPRLAELVERQQAATYAAVERLMSDFQKQEPNTLENKEARNRAIFKLVARMSVIGTLHAVGQAIRAEDTLEVMLEAMFNAPATPEPMNGESDGVAS